MANGWGIGVPIIAFLMVLFSREATRTLFYDAYYNEHLWPRFLALAVAGAIVWFLGQRLNSKAGKVVLDPRTGRELILRPNHSLLWIKMEYWGPLLLILAVALPYL